MSASSVTSVEIEPSIEAEFEPSEVEIERSIPSEIASLIPADVQYFFKRPPLLKEEDPIEYWALVRQCVKDYPAKAIIEWIWLKDGVDLTWEIWRLRRARAAFVRSAPAWEEYAQTLLEAESVDTEKSASQRLLGSMFVYQPVDKLLASAELRRDRIFAQLEFHVAQRLREAIEMVEGDLDKRRLAAA
jgi:hypothetical protein